MQHSPRFAKLFAGRAIASVLSVLGTTFALGTGDRGWMPSLGRAIAVSDASSGAEIAQRQFPLVRFGDRGQDVVELQLRLIDLGYLDIRETGYFGVTTEGAVIDFQRDYGLSPDGQVGDRTWSQLLSLSRIPRNVRVQYPPDSWLYFNDPVLRPGDRGDFVRTLQAALNEVGFGPIREDREYGVETEAAVANFQQLYRLRVARPGEVDPRTAEVLEGVLEGSIAIVGLPDEYDRRLGDRGFDVYEVQRVLAATPRRNADGVYYVGSLTGNYNLATESAVRSFQRDRDIPSTGIIDEQTFEALFADYRYVAVVPFRGRSIPGTIDRARAAIADLDRLFDLRGQELRFYEDRRGPYIDAGRYLTQEAALNRVDNLRAYGLSGARVEYFEDPSERTRLSRAELETKY